MQLSADLSGSKGSSSPKALDFLLTFDPYERTWTSACQELEPTSKVVDDARIPDYGRSHYEYCVNKVMQARGSSRKDAELVVKNRVMEAIQGRGGSQKDAEKVVEKRMIKAKEEVQQRRQESAKRRISLLLKIHKEKRRIQAEKEQPVP